MSVSAGRTKAWRRRALLVFLQLVVIVILAELVVRVLAERHQGLRMVLAASRENTCFDDAEDLRELMNRTMLGFSPGTVQYGYVLNSRSFRTSEYKPQPDPDTFRIVALGDSFTFASGGLAHADHWTTLTERSLRRWADDRTEVLRLGVPDTGPAFQLRLWQLEASRLHPDVVVLAFFVGNDFVDHQQDIEAFGGATRGLSSRLASISALYRVSRNLVRIKTGTTVVAPRDLKIRRSAGVGPGEPVPRYARTFESDRPTFSPERFVAIEARRMALCLRSNIDTFDALAGRVIPTVKRLASEIERSGARFLVMVIPDQYQVDEGLVGQILEATGHEFDDYDLDRPQHELVSSLRAGGIEVLDLLPVFRRVTRQAGDLYRPRNTHWNRRGNEVAAKALTAAIISSGGADDGALHIDDFESSDLSAWSRRAED